MRLALLGLTTLLPACRGADKGGLGSAPGSMAWVEITTSDGATGRVADSYYADGPAFYTPEGAVEHGIVTVMDDMSWNYYNLSLLGKDAGIRAGDVCRDFSHIDESTGGCDWFAGGTADLVLDNGELYDALAWTETDGTLTVTEIREDEAGMYISFDFVLELAQPARTATITGEITDAWTAR